MHYYIDYRDITVLVRFTTENIPARNFMNAPQKKVLFILFISARVAADYFVYDILRPPFDDQFHIAQSNSIF